MEQIPVEVLEVVFDRLPIGHLDKCRQVCKKWQFTIDFLMSFDCLVVYDDLLPINQTHFPSNERVSLRYCIHVDAFNELKRFRKGIYRRFRRLFIYKIFGTIAFSNRFQYRIMECGRFSEAVMPIVSYLNQLEELQLVAQQIPPIILFLPNLKIFKTTHFLACDIFLNAPKLISLSVYRFYALKLVHPETIETLEIQAGGSNGVFQCEGFCEYLTSFTGLKKLLIQDRIVEFDPEFVREFRVVEFMRDLEEIHFFGNVNFRDRGNRLYPVLRELKEQVKRMRIYFHGLEIDCLPDILEKLDRKERVRHRINFKRLATAYQRDFYLANSLSCTETLPLYEVEYSLIEHSELDLFSPRKLPRLERVFLNEQVKDELALGKWLSGSATLKEIVFRRALSPDFYSTLLPVSCPTLQWLMLEAPLDLSFLFKLRFLTRVEFISSDYGLVERLFSGLPYLGYLAFYELSESTKNPRKVLLRIIKRVLERNKIEYELYDGQRIRAPTVRQVFVPRNVFESFESLVEFLRGFNGF